MNGEPWFQLRSEPVEGGMRFILPPRPGGPYRTAGAVFILAGVAFAFGTLAVLGGLLTPSGSRALSPAAKLGLLVSLLPECALVVLGGVWRWGHVDVECREGRLRAWDVWGGFRWSRGLPSSSVMGLEVRALPSGRTRGGADPARTVFSLHALYARGPARAVAAGYPKEWMATLARELGPWLGLPAGPAPIWIEGDVSATETADALLLAGGPPSQWVHVQEEGGLLRLRAGPLGLRGGPAVFLTFGLIWLLFVVFIATMFLLDRGRKGWNRSDYGAVAVLLGFAGVGAGFIVASIHMALRQVIFEVDNLGLRIESTGLWRARPRQWRRDELLAVGVGDSQVEVNNRKLPELQFHLRTGTRRGVLVGFNEADLRWIAARLRQKLQLPARPVQPGAAAEGPTTST